MNVALVMTTDGRTDYLERALESAIENLPPFAPWILVDDSGRRAAEDHYGRFTAWVAHDERQGLAATVAEAWRCAAAYDVDYVLHLEDDFVLCEPPDLVAMGHLLDCYPYLTQMALKRQPVNPVEHAAGGYIEQDPAAYSERWAQCFPPDDHPRRVHWIEHRKFFTLNPSLIPRRVLELGWPAGNEAEQIARLNLNTNARSAIWGRKLDPPRVTHIGDIRAEGWRL